MAYLDRREPAVYVDIEDVSYMGETIESGRTVYTVILCPHRQSLNTLNYEDLFFN